MVSGIPLMALGGSAVTDRYVPHIVAAMFVSIPIGMVAWFAALASWPKSDATVLWETAPRPARVVASTPVSVAGRPSLQLALDVTFRFGDVRRLVTVVPDQPQRRELVRVGSSVSVRVQLNDPSQIEVDWVETVKHARARSAAVPSAIAVKVLRCASCGADLTIGDRTSVVCQYCHTENHVVRS